MKMKSMFGRKAATMLLMAMSFGVLMTSVSSGSSKKGFAHSAYNANCGDLDTVTNVAWWYDWHQTPKGFDNLNCTNSLREQTRVPMVWGWRHGKDYPLYFSNHTSRYVLGFNEPNHHHQSNLTPQQAALAWREIEARADRQNQLLVSPSATRCTSGSERCPMPGVQWFTEFFHACHGCRVDFISTHVYTCELSHVMDFLQELYEHFHKPIWLTEVACPSSSHTTVLNFMKALLPKLEATSYVYRYSWFSSRVRGTGTASHEDSLLHTNRATFTTLGQYYHDFM